MKILSLSVFAAAAMSLTVAVQADTKINLETPVNGSYAQGVDTVRGWAISDETIDRVEMYVDGDYLWDLPMGGARQDVADTFPAGYLDPLNSGFSSAFYFGLLDPDIPHTLTAVVFNGGGIELASDSTDFNVVRFEEDTWQKEPDTIFSSCSTTMDRDGFYLYDLWLNDYEYAYVKFKWFDSVQGFRIVDIPDPLPPVVPEPPLPPVVPPVPPVEPPADDEGCRAHQGGTGNCGNGGGNGGGNGTDDEGLD